MARFSAPLFTLCVVISLGPALGAYTKILCQPSNCRSGSLLTVGNERAIGNKVDNSFEGFADVRSSKRGTVFDTNLRVTGGQAWPRIYEGITSPLQGSDATPGHNKSVNWYIKNAPPKYVSYKGQWTARKKGPYPRPKPEGRLSNGAYLWFNNPKQASKWETRPEWDKYHPKWTFSLEVNVWNRYVGDGYRGGATKFADYTDHDGRYQVRGHNVCHDGDCFYAYYVTLQAPDKGKSNMKLNLNKLMKHLVDKSNALKSFYKLIEVSVAAEGFPGGGGEPHADGRFKATIKDMGRP